MELLEPLRADLAAAVRGAKSPKAARAAIAKVVKKYGKSAELLEGLMRPMVLADMAGQLMVHTYEVGPKQLELSVGDAQDARAFLNLPWPEALAAFQEREIGAEELSKLLADYKETAGVSREIMLDQVQARVYELLEQAVAEGGTFEEFASELEADAPGLGISTSDRGYLQNVFRTNVLGAYGGGRHKALSHPDVVAARPFRQIRTSGDTRVRAHHAAVENAVYRADNEAMAQLHTPFGYQCRCSIVSLAEWDGPVLEAVPADLVDEGFG